MAQMVEQGGCLAMPEDESEFDLEIMNPMHHHADFMAKVYGLYKAFNVTPAFDTEGDGNDEDGRPGRSTDMATGDTEPYQTPTGVATRSSSRSEQQQRASGEEQMVMQTRSPRVPASGRIEE
eukprot:1473142-Rhodomonas_salina.2